MKFQNVAIIYDKVNTPYGGAEVVLKTLQQIFPEADLFTSIYDKNKASWASNFKIKTSFLQHLAKITTNHKLLLPLFPLAFESINLSSYELVISVTSAEAKGVLTKPNQTHICYLLTPPRYLYTHTQVYLSRYKILQAPVFKHAANILLKYLQRWDKSASTRPDFYICISKLITDRLKETYQINDSEIVYPPVDLTPSIKEITQLSTFSNKEPKFYLSISRLVQYKRVDLSIKAALKLKTHLVVAGDGEELNNLLAVAGKEAILRNATESIEAVLQRAKTQNKLIIFTRNINQKDKMTLYKNCEAVLIPGKEDFGITGLEAGIFGKPVIVFYTSGVSEILKDGVHAVHIKSETVAEITYALGKLDALAFDADKLRKNALKYSAQNFSKKLENTIETLLRG